MGTYASITTTITGPNNVLLDLKTNVFENEDHKLCLPAAGDEIYVDGDTLSFSSFWKISWNYQQAFQDLVNANPGISVSINGFCSDGDLYAWNETIDENGHDQTFLDLTFRNTITFECKHEGVLLYNIDRCVAEIKAWTTDVSVEDNVITFTTDEPVCVETELDFIVDADVYHHCEIIEGSDAAIGYDYGEEIEFRCRAEAV